MGEGRPVEIFVSNDFSNFSERPADQKLSNVPKLDHPSWYEEVIDEDLKRSFALNSVLHRGTSKFQDIALLDTKPFGKVLLIDGRIQCAETDGFIYHECLIHPPLLCHPNPKTVFIIGVGAGATAREALKHKSVEKVVMCDIDQEVVDFCRRYVNPEAFRHKKLNLVINEAKAELETRSEKFDIIVGDLSDPIEGGPCYHLFTKSFYEETLKPKLKPNGIYVTQAGPAGIFTHKGVFTSVHNTIKQVFKHVMAYTAHIPSFADTCGLVMASDQPFSVNAEEIDRRIKERIDGELLYLSGALFLSSATLNKTVALSLLNETHVFTEENPRFIHGHGVANRH